MYKYEEKELSEALKVVSSVIINCEKMQPKFEKGTSQHTLLRNRIKAMYISKALITDENIINKYTKEELEESIRPVSSIISKCEKAQLKAVEGTSNHTRLTKMINAMYIAKYLITNKLSKYK